VDLGQVLQNECGPIERRESDLERLHDMDQHVRDGLYRRILYPPSSSIPTPRILHSPAHAVLDPLILDLIALTLCGPIERRESDLERLHDMDQHVRDGLEELFVRVAGGQQQRQDPLDVAQPLARRTV
jgi:hypothetical protein